MWVRDDMRITLSDSTATVELKCDCLPNCDSVIATIQPRQGFDPKCAFDLARSMQWVLANDGRVFCTSCSSQLLFQAGTLKAGR
jgi:hypothetical protein